MSVQETRIALRNLGNINPESIEDYISAGGYEALAKAVKMDPDELISEIENASKLRGRGGAGFNTGFNELEMLLSLSEMMAKDCFCPLGQGALTAFKSAYDNFPEDFKQRMVK